MDEETKAGDSRSKAYGGDARREGYASVREARWVFSFSKLLHIWRVVKSCGPFVISYFTQSAASHSM
jgi:hypothetical protein